MNQQTSRILYFTRRPELEARMKRLVQNPEKNTKIIRHLYEWVKTSIWESEIPFVELNESRQNGNTFGEKLANGIQELVDEGVHHIIVVGNDSPDLQATDLTLALDHLRTGSQVIGRTFSGGSWIIGINAADFDKDEFEKLPWQTNTLGASLRSLLESQGAVSVLTSLHDINDSSGFRLLLELGDDSRLLRLIRSLLFTVKPRHQSVKSEFTTNLNTQATLRAPPIFS